jgi:hypothetical protein
MYHIVIYSYTIIINNIILHDVTFRDFLCSKWWPVTRWHAMCQESQLTAPAAAATAACQLLAALASPATGAVFALEVGVSPVGDGTNGLPMDTKKVGHGLSKSTVKMVLNRLI